MSGSSDDRASKRQRQQALALQPGEGGLWDPTDLQFMTDQGVGIQPGARFRAPTSAKELASWGFAGGGAGPDPMTGLDEWLRKNNMSLQQFQEQYGGLPLVFNADGTATYDPSAQRQSFSYNNPDDGLFHKLAPLALGAIAMGPQITNLISGLSGTSSVAGGAMDMGVGLGGDLGAWGGITPLDTAVGSFEMGVPMSSSTNALEIGSEFGSTPTGDYSLGTQPGQGYGGQGTAGQGLSLGSSSTGGAIGASAETLAGQAGTFLDPITGVGAGTGAGLGLQAPSGLTTLTGGAAATGGASLLSQIARAMGFSEDALKTAASSSPILDTALRALTLYNQGQTSEEAMKLLQQGMATADPFGSQRGFYQDQLKQSYMDPNYFSNNPVFKGIKDMAINDVGRQAAARGYNNSSNVLHDIGSRINNEGLKYATGFQGQLGQLAGGGINPATAAGLASQASNLATQSGNQESFNWGNFIKSIPDAYKSLTNTTQVSPP